MHCEHVQATTQVQMLANLAMNTEINYGSIHNPYLPRNTSASQ